MTKSDILTKFQKQSVIEISREDLASLLKKAAVLRSENTGMAGWCRILSLEGGLLFQEETPRGEILVRQMNSREVADQLAEERLATYERMWDGCGCKIDYFKDASS
jgi:hypothetical protein